MNSLYKWNGNYLGTENNGNIFDINGEYLGWIETNGEVYDRNGVFKGELVDGEYLLRNTTKIPPINKIPKIPPINIIPPIPPLNRIGKIGKIGWEEVEW